MKGNGIIKVVIAIAVIVICTIVCILWYSLQLKPVDSQNIETKIENQVLLVENVIVGNIPESYYNFEGTDRQDTALETMN